MVCEFRISPLSNFRDHAVARPYCGIRKGSARLREEGDELLGVSFILKIQVMSVGLLPAQMGWFRSQVPQYYHDAQTKILMSRSELGLWQVVWRQVV